MKNVYKEKRINPSVKPELNAKELSLIDILFFLENVTFEMQYVILCVSRERYISIFNIIIRRGSPKVSFDEHTAGVDEKLFNNNATTATILSVPEAYEPETSGHHAAQQLAGGRNKRRVSRESREARRARETRNLIEIWRKRYEEKKRTHRQPNDLEHIDAYFRSIALTVKQFVPELQIQAKLDFIRLLSRLELQDIRSNK